MPWIALTVAAAVAVGILVEGRFGARAGEAARALLRVMLFGLVPFVVFFNLAHFEPTADVGAGIALGWVALLSGGLIAHAVGRRLLGLDRPATGALINSTLQPNSGYLGLPLCAAVLGADALDEAIVYDVIVVAPVLLLGVFGVGAAFGTRAGEGLRERAKAFLTRNPPLFAAIAGLLAPGALAPEALVDASRLLVYAMLPLGFFAVGVTLAEEAEQGAVSFPPAFDRRIATAIVLRLVLAPLLLLALAAPLIDLPDAYLLLAAMPPGINGLVVAHAYGLDMRLAAGAIAWATALVLAVGTVAAAIV